MASDLRELEPDVVRYIEEHIDTVPHLEALILLWESGSQGWTPVQAAARLYVSEEAASSILDDLFRRQLVQRMIDGDQVYYRYGCTWDEKSERLARVAAVYRRQTVKVASLIHSKASTAVHDFARAFRLKKE
jgi:hypothetical protein